MAEALALVTPGSALREGVDRILQAELGALMVIGDSPEVLELCTGGFHLDAEMTPQRLSELAKMDGAIILSADGARIVWANVHLVPDPTLPTIETGTRHRTAERMARSVRSPVVAVSEEMSTITVYQGDGRRVLQSTNALAARANRLLQTLERFRARFDEVAASLMSAEIEDLVTVKDVATVLQRAEMVIRVAGEITDCLIELGDDGRLLRLQLNELGNGVVEERRLVLEDYLRPPAERDPDAAVAALARPPAERDPDAAVAALAELATDDLLDLEGVAATFTGAAGDGVDLDATVEPRGLRLLARVPRVSDEMAGRIVTHFNDLHRVLRAPVSELAQVTGIGEDQAKAVKDGVARLAEASILDRFA